MNPIYFPFTYLPQSIYQALTAVFPRISVCQPSKSRIPASLSALREKGGIDFLLPDEINDGALNRLLKEYHHWANIHQGESSDIARHSPSKTPFFDDSSSVQIRSDIKKSILDSEPPEEKVDQAEALLISLAFLTMAQEFDEQQYDLVKDIQRLDQMQKNLFDVLRGDELGDIEKGIDKIRRSHEMVADHMPQERINAWTRLFLHQLPLLNPENTLLKAAPLFVTSSQSVMECLVEATSDVEMVLCVKGIPMHKVEKNAATAFYNQFQDKLTHLAEGNQLGTDKLMTWPDTTPVKKEGATLSVYHVSDTSPIAFLAQCAGTGDRDKNLVPNLPWRHTLVGVLTIQDYK